MSVRVVTVCRLLSYRYSPVHRQSAAAALTVNSGRTSALSIRPRLASAIVVAAGARFTGRSVFRLNRRHGHRRSIVGNRPLAPYRPEDAALLPDIVSSTVEPR